MFKSWPGIIRPLCILLVSIPVIIYFIDKNNNIYIYNLACESDCLEKRLSHHILVLSEDIGERHYENPGSLARTADYIEQEWTAAGLRPVRLSFADNTFHNIVAEVRGSRRPDEIIVVGAHYDTVWLSPGANDNASGIAALLELSRNLVNLNPVCTVRFAAFTNEEQPFAGTDEMGSIVYSRLLHQQDENVIAMYSLEMLGYYSDEPDSQRYPFPLNWLYPDEANFIAFVGNIQSGYLLWRSLNAFRRYSDFPVQGLVMSERLVPDIRRSDHASFWDAGYPAVMVTDTAEYRNIHYHTVGDVIRTLDLKKMAAVVTGLSKMLADLAGINED